MYKMSELKELIKRFIEKKIEQNSENSGHSPSEDQKVITTLEKKLREYGVRIFRDIHASGHASREDLRDLINLINPEHIIPAHGEEEMKQALVDLAIEKGYKKGKTVHLVHDGGTLSF